MDEEETFPEEELMFEEDFDMAYNEEEEIIKKESVREPFRKEEIRLIMKDEIERCISGRNYDQKETKEIADICSNAVLEKIKNFGHRIKYLTNCLVIPAKLKTFQCYSVNLWGDLDDYVTVECDNGSICFIMTVWGVNCY